LVQKRIRVPPEPISQQILPPPYWAQSAVVWQGKKGVPAGQFAARVHSQGDVQSVAVQQTVAPWAWLQFVSFTQKAPRG
jgi:hypothetical protein